MPDLTQPMSNEQIEKLDYFDKAQLYHNVYINKKYSEIPKALRSYYTADEGLSIVKATISNASIKDPYEIVKLIKALNPSMPQTYQEIYTRAAYLANLCDTSIEKILRSTIFNTKNFIPNLNEDVIKAVLSTKTIGALIQLIPSDYTPSPDSEETPSSYSDFANETKIYFTLTQDGNIVCNKPFSYIKLKTPQLPAAELIILGENNNVQNINYTTSWVDIAAYYVFTQVYDNIIKMYIVKYESNGNIEIEESELIINGNA